MTIFQDDELLILNKPPGIAVQGGTKIKKNIDDLLKSSFKSIKTRLVHRIDKETSGILIIALNRQIADYLSNLFREKKIIKKYWALNVGNIKRGEGIINKKISQEALKTLKVDEAGLEQLDRDYLNLVINKFAAGPVGLDTLSTALGEERLTLEDMVEPYLLQQGFIMRTPRGRVATDLAFSHLGIVRHNHTQDLYGK